MLLLPINSTSSDRLYGFYRFDGRLSLTETRVAGIGGIVELDLSSANYFLPEPHFFYGPESHLATNASAPVSSLDSYLDKRLANKRHFLIPLSALSLNQPRQSLISQIQQQLSEGFLKFARQSLFVPVNATQCNPRSRSVCSFDHFPKQLQDSASHKGFFYKYIKDTTKQDPEAHYIAVPTILTTSSLPLNIFPFSSYDQALSLPCLNVGNTH